MAGIAAAKKTGDLIPLAHPLPLTYADLDIDVKAGEGLVVITSEARVVGRTGVEMEAMTACAVAALTVYDMVKALERGVRIESIELVEKTGGRSGTWTRDDSG
jgi:cyclic pyranopterin phosphate synthase